MLTWTVDRCDISSCLVCKFPCVFSGLFMLLRLVVGFAVYRFWFGFDFDVLAVALMFASNLCCFYIGAPCSLGVVDLCCGFVVVW